VVFLFFATKLQRFLKLFRVAGYGEFRYTLSMAKSLRAEIISIGTELLLGEIVDTNSTYLSQQLRDLGIFVFRKTTIGDNRERLATEIKEALERSDIVIVGGGLGPTDDDLTREAISDVYGEKPEVNAHLLEELEKMFSRRNRKMSETNKKQAWLIPSAIALENPIGTACGWLVNKNDKILAAMPGPPHEMKRMWREKVLPHLPQTNSVLFHETLHTIGIGEGDLAEVIKDYTRSQNPSVGTYARGNGVDVRIAASAGNIDEAKTIVQPFIDGISSLLKDYVYGTNGKTIVESIKELLIKTGQTIATIESITGGALASDFTACSGISSCYVGGAVTYSNEMKVQAGVKPEIIEKFGVVSRETAIAMADAAKKQFKVDWAISTTGVAGPDSLEGKKPGYAWIGLAGPDATVSYEFDWPGEREMVIKRVRRMALMMIFNTLKESR
jgi:nicotinamide-nucleotide amidase